MTMANFESLTLLNLRYEIDDYGQQIEIEPIETEVLCKKKTVTYNEFYKAKSAGEKVEIIVTVKSYEYNNEKKVKYNDEIYDVKRTFQKSFEEIELSCSRD